MSDAKDYVPGKPVSEGKKEQLISEHRMAQKELDDAKAAYQKGEYGKAASELADAAKYGAKDAYENVTGAATTEKTSSSGSVPSGTKASASTTAPAKSNA